MVCIYCQNKCRVINSRYQKRTNGIWRRRKCLNCNSIFTTQEAALLNEYWSVRTKQGHLSSFNRNRLFISIYKSLSHRKGAIDDATDITDTIINKLLDYKVLVLDIDYILDISLSVLNNFDKVAAIYFKAYYIEK